MKILAGETKGSLTSGFEWGWTHPAANVPRGVDYGKWAVNSCIRMATTVDVGTDSWRILLNGIEFLDTSTRVPCPVVNTMWHEHICQTLGCADSAHPGVPALCCTYDDRPRH